MVGRARPADAARSRAFAPQAQPAREPAVRSRRAPPEELAMDVSAMLDIHPAPRAVFDRLGTHRHRVRFQVRNGGAWEPVTWGHFATQIRGVARWLVEHELEPGERVAIYAPNSVAWASAALGAQTAGAGFVPIYPASPPDQGAYILEHAEIRYVFVAGEEPIKRLEKVRHTAQVVALDEATWRDAA